MYRQGDVLLVPVDALPYGEAVEVPREGGRIVLAHGEVTGHAHAVAAPNAKLVELFHDHYLVAPEPVKVMHEEHATVELPAGTYQVIHQREYTPEEIRNVAD